MTRELLIGLVVAIAGTLGLTSRADAADWQFAQASHDPPNQTGWDVGHRRSKDAAKHVTADHFLDDLVARVSSAIKLAARAKNKQVRFAAALSLHEFLPHDESLYDVAIDLTDDDDPLIKSRAVQILAAVQGELPNRALNRLMNKLADPDISREAREAAMTALTERWESHRVVAHAADLLSADSTPDLQMRIIELLSRQGGKAQAAVTALLECGGNRQLPAEVRAAAIETAAKITREAVIADNLARRREREAAAIVQETLARYDANNDEQITQDEIRGQTQDLILRAKNPGMITTSFRSIDENRDRVISSEELSALSLRVVSARIR